MLRMSGTATGTAMPHVAQAVGGPLSPIRKGDPTPLDLRAGRAELLVELDELAARQPVLGAGGRPRRRRPP
jgi:dihydroxyacid dehydratase/phosphogluconate dehydratase